MDSGLPFDWTAAIIGILMGSVLASFTLLLFCFVCFLRVYFYVMDKLDGRSLMELEMQRARQDIELMRSVREHLAIHEQQMQYYYTKSNKSQQEPFVVVVPQETNT